MNSDQFVIVHSQKSVALPEAGQWQTWKTCLRTMAFTYGALPALPSQAGQDVFTNAAAYSFFLEVICGLHSPLLGETEVMGQFRELAEKVLARKDDRLLVSTIQSLLADAKAVRASALKNLGQRTYGSLLRRFLDEAESVSIVGAGKLTTELLPWVKSKKGVVVFCRNLNKGRALQKKYPEIEINLLGSKVIEGNLVIAAPINAAELRRFLGGVELRKTIDLRDTSTSDPLKTNTSVITLKDFLDHIKEAEKESEAKVEQAKVMIRKLSEKWFHGAEIRPFGWEDLCG